MTRDINKQNLVRILNEGYTFRIHFGGNLVYGRGNERIIYDPKADKEVVRYGCVMKKRELLK